MELLKKQPPMKAAGRVVHRRRVGRCHHRGEDPSRTRANAVRFRPRRPHRLALPRAGQIVEGIALVQSRGAETLEAHPGDVIWTPPGEEHCHGAAPDHLTHIAPWETDDIELLEHVTDREYSGHTHSTRA